ncbi:MAG: hypothetical protein WCL06_10680 [Bacteroidota bacterium]
MEKIAKEYRVSFLRVLLLLSALISLSVLSAISLRAAVWYEVLTAIGFVIVFSIGILFATLLLSFPNGKVRKQFGFSAISKATTNGFAMLFPFAVLALITDLIFQWNATQAITCAAIFTCISVAAGDLMNLGGKRTVNLIFSFLASVMFIALYMGLIMGAKIILSQI